MKNFENLKQYSNFNLSNVMGGTDYTYTETVDFDKHTADEALITTSSSGRQSTQDGHYDCVKGAFDWYELPSWA